jgi:hypothetical protein
MPKENTKNFLAGPDKEQWVEEAYEATKNRFADQETQVSMAGPYTAENLRRHSQTSPRVELPSQSGQGETEEHMAKYGAWRGQKRPGQRLNVMLRIDCDGGFLWKLYIPRRNDGILYIHIYISLPYYVNPLYILVFQKCLKF